MRAAAALGLALLLPACISVGGGGEPLEQRTFDLQPALPPTSATAAPAEAEGPEALWVEPFLADPALDREEMVWRRGPVEAGAYGRFRWVRLPRDLVRENLADAVARSGACAVVATEPRAAKADYALRGFLARFEEVDRDKTWAGVAEVRVALVRLADGTEILRRTYAAEAPAPARNPAGTAEALRACLDRIAAVLTADVKEALRRDREGGEQP